MNRLLNNLIHKFSSKLTKITDLQKEFVYNTYDAISEHFNHTRFARWPRVKNFINSLEDGTILCDLGCGNGKYFNLGKCHTLGLDRSLKLLEIVKQKNKQFQVFAADTLNVPIRKQSCDAVLSIAVIHHLSTPELRFQSLQEVKRILRKNGRALVYVWCFEQHIKHKQELPLEYYKKFDYLNKEQDVFVKWHLQQKFLKGGQEQNSKKDQISVIKRYYHLFKKGQLQQLVKSVQGLQIIKSQYDKQNWCVQLRKTTT